MTAWGQLEEREAAVDEARRVAGEREREARRAAGALEGANAAFLAFVEDVAAGARPDDAEERGRLQRECAAASGRRAVRTIPVGDAFVDEVVDEVAEAVAAGARRAIETREEELREFVRLEFPRLVAERSEASVRVTAEAEDALSAFQAAHHAYGAERARWRRLMGLRGFPPDVPADPLQDPVRDRDLMAGGRVPAPIPAAVRDAVAS